MHILSFKDQSLLRHSVKQLIPMNEPLERETIMEVREDLMLSPAGDSEPTLRTSHFLKPIANAEPFFELLPSSSLFEPKEEGHLAIRFSGWHHPQKKWVEWVDALKQKYESLWKKAGIFEAIMSTKCYIPKNKDLVFRVVEKWCCETNTFVFPWGEATITLEDVMVLGGYPVLGDSVFTSLENHEMREVEKKLILARRQPWKSKKGKASTSAWMDIFIDKGSEIEHEAFLATWLSFFVFPPPHNDLIKLSFFPIAIHLARGNPIALAPAVLARVYKDLGLFHKTIVGFTKYPVGGDKCPSLEVTLESPLVQIWVWERFKNLQPVPNLINNGDPLLFRWHKVRALKIDNVRLALNSAVDDFLWRPYVRYAEKCGLFYPKDEIWVPFKKDLDKELLSFVTCLRVSELVGTDSIEQYLPHRVAMQFGMDQDVPGCVPRFNETKVIAWENYCRPISDRNLFFPSRFFEADVTTRYAKWWKQLVFGHQDFVKNIVRKKRSASSSKHRPRVGIANRSGKDADVPPWFPPKLVDSVIFGKSCDDGSKARKDDDDIDADFTSGFVPKHLKTVPSENSVQDGLKACENINADAPTSFPPKHNILTPFVSVENCKPVMEEYKCGGMIHVCKHLSNQCCSASSSDYEKILPLKKPVAKYNIEFSVGGLEECFKDANGSKESRVCLSGTQGESHSYASEIKVMELEQRISILERVITELKMARFGRS